MKTPTPQALFLSASLAALAWGCGGEPVTQTVVTTCEVARGDDGATFTCPDGTTATVRDGYPGADGQGRVVLATSTSELDDSPACPGGGVAFTVGPDADADGAPDPDTSQTSSVCGGAAGEDGLRALFVRRDVPVGDECASGGFVVDLAFDADDDQTVDPGEVAESLPFCDLICPEDHFYDEDSNLCYPGVVIALDGVVERLAASPELPQSLSVGDPARVRLAYDPDAPNPYAVYAEVGDAWFAQTVLSTGSRYDAGSNQLPPRDVASWSFLAGLESSSGAPPEQLTLLFEALFGAFFNVDAPPRVLNPFELRNAPDASFSARTRNGSVFVRLDVSSLTTLDYLAADLQEAP
jgi:hypothetical protein